MHPLADPAAVLRPPPAPAPAAARAAAPGAPDWPVMTALRTAGLLVGVPVTYLVPDPALLDDGGSVRFFVVDPRWVRALRIGMLTAGGEGPADRELAAAVLDAHLPDAAQPLTGMLLATTLVAEYPALAVRAWTGAVGPDDDPDDPAHGAAPVELLRCERITPSTLVVLFATAPDVVVVEEPHRMIRLGVRRDGATTTVGVRSATGALLDAEVAVPFRGDPADGVVDVAGLATALSAAVAASPAPDRAPDPAASSGALALQLVTAPARQRYQRGAP